MREKLKKLGEKNNKIVSSNGCPKFTIWTENFDFDHKPSEKNWGRWDEILRPLAGYTLRDQKRNIAIRKELRVRSIDELART